jgi:acyl-CoA reductase-like NAD-dependent aldehyde dehydrogenase
MKKESEKFIPHDPFDINSEVGCVVSKEQEERIRCYINKGIESGAKIVSENKFEDLIPGGCYVVPTIFDEVNPNSMLAQEEIFGPVVVVIGVSSIQEAISIANDSKFGLAASVWTNDLDEAYQVSRALRTGIVHINSYGDDDNSVPFGGIKESGIGKDKSIFAFNEYSIAKTTWIHLDKLKR